MTIKTYSAWSLLRGALSRHRDWSPAWTDATPRPRYDVIIVGGGGHGLATAYYLAKNHRITNVAVLERGWIGGGNTGRNTTIVRSNYLFPESARLYDFSLTLYEGLSQALNFNIMLSQRGLVVLAHSRHDLNSMSRWANAMRMNGIAAEVATRDEVAAMAPALDLSPPPPPATVQGAGRALAATHVPGVAGKHFVDLQNDVAIGDIGLAAQENYRSVEHLKRYTTTGMGTDQGKTSNVNALVLMGEFTGREPGAVGMTKFRPPFAPVSLGLLVGRRVGARYRPLKRLPAESWHREQGALFEQFGSWVRPAAYPKAGETLDSAAQREAAAVRRSVGFLDGSPLGKMELFGPDAAEFLDLMYLGTMSTLRVGQARYGVVLNENGIIMDDGIVARLGGQHYWVNTTSAGAERTVAGFEEWLQCEYPHMKVMVTAVTSRWANVTVAGPHAWRLLAACGFDPAFAPPAMKHMTMRSGTLDGVPLRVLRASFSGELGYEVNLPADEAESLLRRLWARAPEFDAVPYGIEALEILRTEKGFIHIGTDTDGTTMPGDVGFGRAVDRKAANFVGRRSLSQPAARDPDRPRLVGLAPVDGHTLLPVGAQIAAAPPPTPTEGHITSSYRSPSLGAPVALGMLMRGTQRLGERVRVHHLGSTIDAVVVKAPFIDPSGERLHG